MIPDDQQLHQSAANDDYRQTGAEKLLIASNFIGVRVTNART